MPPPKDPEKRALWFQRQAEARKRPDYFNPSYHKKGEPAWNKDQHYVDLLGQERTSEISKKMSASRTGRRLRNNYRPTTEGERLFNKLHQLLLAALGGKKKRTDPKYKHPPEKIAEITAATKKQWEKFHESQIEYRKIHPPTRRETYLYRQWRRRCLVRDNYTCQHCGIREVDISKLVGNPSTCHLHVHHLKCWSLFIALRYEDTNGMTLCPLCHRKEEKRIKKVLGPYYQLTLRNAKLPPLPQPDLDVISRKLDMIQTSDLLSVA
jgi:hypothetical protein